MSDRDPSIVAFQAAIERHAPFDWRDRYEASSPEGLRDRLSEAARITTISVDVRLSTMLLKESIELRACGEILGSFVDVASRVIREMGGWFDKFTGDGFLAYWIHTPTSDRAPSEGRVAQPESDVHNILMLCVLLHERFENEAMPRFRQASSNIPGGIGLVVGLDSGDALMMTPGGEPTIFGKCVVGAVRMADCSEAGETVANVGTKLMVTPWLTGFLGDLVTVGTDVRGTKEYPKHGDKGGQEVYPLSFAPWDQWEATN